MFLEDCKVLENRHIGGNYYLMKLQGDKVIEPSCAGQFFMLQCKNEATLLRRPISLHYINRKENVVEFYYEVKGKGTKEFSCLSEGDFINIQGPLGHGFTTDVEKKTIVVVGGGMGIAPMKLLIESLSEKNNVIFICGGRNAESIKILENMNLENIETIITTDDGSKGRKGNVTLPLREILSERKVDGVYTCGPHIMMEFVAKTAEEFGVYCEVSLEERMACGVKACVGCSILTNEGMKKVCHDGPVFDSRIVIDVNPKETVPCSCGK